MYICNMETKKCKTCNEVKTVDLFNKAGKYKTKQVYQSYCKPCQNKKVTATAMDRYFNDPEYRAKHLKANVTRSRIRYKNDPEYRAMKTKSSIESKNKRLENDPFFKMTHRLRRLISISISNQGYTKKSRTYEILGCSFEEFRTHIESQFVDGMNWDNHGEWHYDHIKPISLANTEAEAIALNHYTNFQPLWAEDNLRKSNKY